MKEFNGNLFVNNNHIVSFKGTILDDGDFYDETTRQEIVGMVQAIVTQNNVYIPPGIAVISVDDLNKVNHLIFLTTEAA